MAPFVLAAALLAAHAAADGLKVIQQGALTSPPIRHGLLGSATGAADRLEIGRAQSYRGELATSAFRLDRAGLDADRAVQERLWQLGAERSRIEQGLRVRALQP
ncbi:MAG: hypothetical protein WD673_07610 [Alphaproteobacteria bacterium]